MFGNLDDDSINPKELRIFWVVFYCLNRQLILFVYPDFTYPFIRIVVLIVSGIFHHTCLWFPYFLKLPMLVFIVPSFAIWFKIIVNLLSSPLGTKCVVLKTKCHSKYMALYITFPVSFIFLRRPNPSSIINCVLLSRRSNTRDISLGIKRWQKFFPFWRQSLLLLVCNYCASWSIPSTSLVPLVPVVHTPNPK